VLYIALTGILIIRGYTDEAGSALLGRFLKMGLVVWVMTGSSVFQQYVFTFFFTTLPTSLQSAVSQGNSQASSFQASTFDGVWYQAYLAGWVLWEKGTASGSWLHPGTWLGPIVGAIAFWAAAATSIVIGFAIWLVSRVFLGLIIAVGPILIPLALFQATRAIFEHWISSMISCVLLQIMTIIMMTVITRTEQQILTSFKATMESSTTSTVDGMGLLLAGVMFFGVAAFVGLHLPQVATSIAGGVHFHARSL
jgi:type IV secretion system protein VirB6